MSAYDKAMPEPTQPEEVMVVTQREVIEGMLFHNENVRLSDALNAEGRQHNRYICLKDAAVYSVQTGKLIFRTCFLLVSHLYIIYMTPRDCVILQSDQHEPAMTTEEEAGITKVAEMSGAPPETESPAPESPAATTPKPASEAPHPVAVATNAGQVQIAILGQDGHLYSQEAMLKTLDAIRNRRREDSSSEPGQG